MEDQDHIIRKCGHKEMRQIRKQAVERFNERLLVARAESPRVYRIAERYREVAISHVDGALLWVGQMPDSLQATIGLDIMITDSEWQAIMNTISPLFEGAMAIYTTRHRIIREKELLQEGMQNYNGRRSIEDMERALQRKKDILKRKRGLQSILEFFPPKAAKKNKMEMSGSEGTDVVGENGSSPDGAKAGKGVPAAVLAGDEDHG
jgi:hypothetical protein